MGTRYLVAFRKSGQVRRIDDYVGVRRGKWCPAQATHDGADWRGARAYHQAYARNAGISSTPLNQPLLDLAPGFDLSLHEQREETDFTAMLGNLHDVAAQMRLRRRDGPS
jgi:hypothetical protein